MNARATALPNDDFPPITIGGGGGKREPLPKGSYKAVVTEVKFSPISEWPDWKREQAVERHNEREDERAKEAAANGKPYEKRYATMEGDTPSGLSLAESAQYVWFMRVIAGKHEGEKVRPYYTGVSLNSDKKYRTKSNLYKLLDAALPDVEASIAANEVDPRDATGYPFMVSLDLTDKGNNKVTGFMQSDDHGERIDLLEMEGATDLTDAEEIPF